MLEKARLTSKREGIAQSAQSQPKRLYNVLTRFWDPKFDANSQKQIEAVTIYLAVPSKYIGVLSTATDFPSKDNASKTIKESIERIFFDSELRYKPAMSKIVVKFFSSDDNLEEQFPKIYYEMLGRHPTYLYRLLTTKKDFKILNNATDTKIYRKPLQLITEDPKELTKIFRNVVGSLYTLRKTKERNGKQIQYIKGEGAEGTITTVSSASSQAAAGIKRELSQKQVMSNLSANVILKLLFREDPYDKRQLRAEWLHRSARSFGGRSNAEIPGQLSNTQDIENLVLGTVETNTTMLRYEMFIKRYVHNAKVGCGDKPATMQVTTRLIHASSKDKRIESGLTSLWFGHHLLYKFESEKLADLKIDDIIVFHPFDRRVPLRLEGELDIMMEELIYGWNSLGDDEDDESEDEVPLDNSVLDQRKKEEGSMEEEDDDRLIVDMNMKIEGEDSD
ncbi:hypothetical protein NHQ30_002009 [Ciborinia camelliae]|nr:hypothetical protein NHQ30_002009 [Ciborinia camelliae]